MLHVYTHVIHVVRPKSYYYIYTETRREREREGAERREERESE